MENGVTDRLWDKDVQGFIEACKHVKLTGVTLGYSVMEDGRKILNVSGQYQTRFGGLLPIGYGWVNKPRLGWVPEVFVGQETAPAANQSGLFFRLAWRAGLLREWKHLASALVAVGEIFFRAQRVRDGLDKEHIKALGTEGESSIVRAQELTLQTLNDLAYLYSSH